MSKTIKIIQINKGISDLASITIQINELIVKQNPQIVVREGLKKPKTSDFV